jgi:hypothetical protein
MRVNYIRLNRYDSLELTMIPFRSPHQTLASEPPGRDNSFPGGRIAQPG